MTRMALVLLMFWVAPLSAAPKKKPKAKAPKKMEYEFKAGDAVLRQALAGVRQACKSPKLKLEMDWPSFKPQLKDKEAQVAAAGLCETVADGLKSWCEERETKPGRQLTAVHCSFRREALRFQGERKGPAVWAYFSFETANLSEEMNGWLKKAF